jgi:molecular chaperone HscB
MARSYFDVLGVAPVFHLHSAELEKQFLTLSKQFHPDRFAKAAPRERLEAVQKTTDLNLAYKTLRDPVRRAEYLLKLKGLDVADEQLSSVKASPLLLGEMMELNEQLADARAAANIAAVRELADAVKEQRDLAMQAVEEGFRRVDAGDDAPLAEIAQALIAMRYHARFLEQAAAVLEGDELPGGL